MQINGDLPASIEMANDLTHLFQCLLLIRGEVIGDPAQASVNVGAA